MKLPIYLDYHATTPVDPRVLAAMLPYFTEQFGNAASRNHSFGWTAKDAVENARAQVASLIGGVANEVIFTSGATESNNLAIKGIAETRRNRGSHIITCATEHRSVVDTCRKLESQGATVTYLPVDATGRIDPDELRDAITDQTILITVMVANNEIGVLQPVEQIGAIARERGIVFHTDAVQAMGRVPFDVNRVEADLVSISAHKIYGPKGIGALYVRRRNRRVELAEQISGGGHERGLRSGTLNVPGAVGFGRAAAICTAEMPAESERLRLLRNRLNDRLHQNLGDIQVNGSMAHRLPNNLHVSFAHLEGESLLMAIDDVALSSGAACTSASHDPSHVLRALGVDDELSRASLRFGLGRWTTEAEIDYVAEKVTNVVRRLREMSPLQAGDVEAEPFSAAELNRMRWYEEWK
jgi:cysteine desulfurase